MGFVTSDKMVSGLRGNAVICNQGCAHLFITSTTEVAPFLHCNSAKIFQKTKCSMCNSPLELPSVHFLCGHSFHQHCFESYAESEAECPTCTPENRKVMDMLRAQDQKRDVHDHFNRQVPPLPSPQLWTLVTSLSLSCSLNEYTSPR